MGLNRLYCRRHEDHYERHGSYLKSSYSGPQLAPYRAKALRILKAQEGAPKVKMARSGIEAHYASSGAAIETFQVRGLSPEQRALVTWARLRQAKVIPVELLSAWLAVQWIIQDDEQRDHREEFRIVQVGKIIHRLAGGSNRRWEREQSGGAIKITEIHKYSASRGKILRHLGRQLERVAEILGDINFTTL